MATKSRQPVKALNKSTSDVAANAAAEKARKAASKRALKEATAPAKPAKPEPKVKTPEQQQAEHEAYLAALRVDAEALGVDPEAYIAEQLGGVKPVKDNAYTGPMLILRDAAKTYVTGKNGNPHCNDDLAQILDGLERAQVVEVLIDAMRLGMNPYIHLNPGQQSMNLRNKARGQLKNGLIKAEDITAAIKKTVK